MKAGRIIFGGAAVALMGMAAPASAQLDVCYNEVDDGSGVARCTVVGGGGRSVDPRYGFGAALADEADAGDAAVVGAVADAIDGDPR